MDAIKLIRREAEIAEPPEVVTKDNMTSTPNLDASSSTTGSPNGLNKIGADIMAKVNERKKSLLFCIYSICIIL